LKKESFLEKIFIGAIGSIVATIIIKITTTDIDYTSISAFFTSDVKLPVWSLILIAFLVLLVAFIAFISKKYFELKLKNEKAKLTNLYSENSSSLEDGQDLNSINAEQLHFKIGKRVITHLMEDSPKNADELCKLIVSKGLYNTDQVEEVIDELVQKKVLASTISSGFRLHSHYDSNFTRYFDKAG